MLTPTLLDIADAASLPGLAARILAGDIAIVRQGLQQARLRGRVPARVDRTGGNAHIRVEPSEGGE